MNGESNPAEPNRKHASYARLCIRATLLFFAGCLFALALGCLGADRLKGESEAAGFSSSSWKVEDGLFGNSLTAVAPTPDGYLWVGGLNGLARFDGVRFVRYRLWDGLTALPIKSLLVDRKERLWIGTLDGGLTVREGNRFRAFTHAEGMKGENIQALAEDRDGNIWVGTEAALMRWDGRFSDISPPLQKDGRQGVNSVACGSRKIFAVTDDWRVWEWSQNSWRVLPPLGKSGFRFDQIFLTRDGALWCRLYPSGLARLDETVTGSISETNGSTLTQSWRVFGAESDLPNSYLSSVLERANGDLLFGSFESGLYRFRDGSATPVGMNEPPDKDGVLALSEDSDGNVWVGARSIGLVRLRSPRVRTLTGGEVVRVARVAHDTNGRLWLGGAEGLWVGGEGSFVSAPPPERLTKWAVAAMLPAVEGGVWFGVVSGGLWRFNPGKDEKPVALLRGSNINISVLSLAKDRSEGMWFGTANGKIGHQQRRGLKLYSPEESAQKRISVLASDPDGGVWAGTEGAGVLRLEEHGRVSLHLSKEDGLPGKAIRCLVRDREGALWIGTVGGLVRWKNSRLQVYDSRHGLPEESISSLVEDDAGHLWCTANNYLFRVNKLELEQIAAGRSRVAHPLIVGPGDGLKPVPFAIGMSPEAIRGPEGRLFFPRIWDVLTLSPEDFQKPSPTPRPRIEDVFVDGESAGASVSDAIPLVVPPYGSQLEIRYTAFQWAGPETLRFRYRLAGVDKRWTEAGAQRVASFRRLPPGRYRFEATAAVSGADWAEPPASLAFVIEPHFWQALWFRAIVLLLGASSVAAVYWRRVWRIEERRRVQANFSRQLIQQQEAERKRIAAELHDSLEQNLLVIKNRALLALDKGEVPAKLKESLDEISSVSSDSIQEVRAIAGNLRPHQLDRLGLTRALSAMLRNISESSGLDLTSDLDDVKGLLSKEAEINLYRIVQESLNNILKHAQATAVTVTLKRNGGTLSLHLEDNGRGFDASPATVKGDGSGFGLTGMNERARIVGGKFQIHSAPGKGTKLVVEVPVSDSTGFPAHRPK